MALTKIGIDAIEGAIGTGQLQDNAVTTGKIAAGAVETSDIDNTAVTTDKLANTAVTVAKLADTLDLSSKTVTLAPTTTGLGMSITSLAYPGDDTAVDTSSPGTVTLIGTGFEAGTLVYVDTVSNANSASSVVISGTTQITFTPPAKSAATYNVWLVGPTGRIAILANGIQYSGTPSWSGQSTLLSSLTEVSIQLAASGDTPLVYSLVSGTLPTGVTLSSTGLISGTVTGLESNTTFTNIVVKAQDPQNQDASITLSLSITVQHRISRSLRFDSSATPYLNRTFSTPTNNKIWTWSCWFKLGSKISDGNFRSFLEGFTGSNDVYCSIAITGDKIRITQDNGSGGVINVDGNSILRDPSAWYHVVLAFDSTQATSTNRVKMYINGVQIPLTFSATPTLNMDTWINSANVHRIAQRWNTTSSTTSGFDGYMAEINFVDGQQLTPDSFGRTDSTTGVWVPISYSGAYGNNGFYLNFSDNSDVTATTLGKDFSGNSNNWTPNGFSVTSDSDSFVDSPTSYGDDTGVGGEVRGNYATWNPLIKFAYSPNFTGTYSNGNLDVATGGNTTQFAGTINLFDGCYWEITPTSIDGARSYIGIVATQSTMFSSTTAVAYDATYTVVYSSSGSVYVNVGSANTLYGSFASWTNNDVISIAFKDGKIYFAKNGTWINSGVPASGTGFVASGWDAYGTLLPYAGYNSSYSANFGQRPFAHAAPTGFKCLTVQNLPEPAIADASDHFNTVVYTGISASQSVTGVGFQPDLLWIKSRVQTYNHYIWDSIRGAGTAHLISNSTNAEASDPTTLGSFDADGFSPAGGTGINDSGSGTNGYVAWSWNAGGTTVTNNAGSIESQVRANTTAGISIVTYTTQSSGTATVGHGLGVAPSLILVKPRNAVFQWDVYHAGIGKDAYLVLNSTAAQTTGATTVWNSVAPTSTVFSLGSAWASAAPGALTVAYCFAEIEGFSKFGTYTGNGAADGPFVYTGFRPAFVLVKNAGTSGTDWQLHDTTRSPSNVVSNRLQPNINAVETTNYDLGDILSNGFKIRQTNNSWNGTTMIYMAFAENPFKYAVAR